MSDSTRDLERLSDLAVDRLLGTLSDEDALEYRRLKGRYPDFDAGDLERAAAALHLATGIGAEPMPASLQRRLLDDGIEMFSVQRHEPPTATHGTHRGRWQTMAGWLAAAACLAAAIPTWLERSSPPIAPPLPPLAQQTVKSTADTGLPQPVASVASGASGATSAIPDPARDRANMLAANPHLLQRAWRPGGDPAGLQVSGDIVWDPASQSGYMRFVGLRRNEPNAEQYQLWIFDATRDARYPVDGGVFDVTGRKDGDVIPIKAKLPIGVPLMFAVTIERRGGVVVSDRERIAAIANTT